MPADSVNVGERIRKFCRVRKRGCTPSSSSSSSFARNYRLKRALLVGKRVGSRTTPVPLWKMMMSSSRFSQSLDNDKAFKYLCAKGGDNKAKELSVSARKLAATLWEIDGLCSPRIIRECLDDKISEVGFVVGKDRILEEPKLGSVSLHLSDLFLSPVSEIMDPPKVGSHRRRASAGSQKHMRDDCNLGGAKSLHDCLVEVDQTQNHARSPCRHIVGTKNRLKDVYSSIITSKELLKVMSRVSRIEQQNSTSLSLFSALKFELDRACTHVGKLIQEQKMNRGEIDVLLKQFENEKVVWKLKEQDRIRGALTCIAGELETEKKLRRQTERLNKKLGRELAETKESLIKTTNDLDSEKRAREILEQVCDELARGIGEDRAEVEELKKESAKVWEEVEKEREMLQLADVIREERVQMKLSEAKYQFEEKNALVDKLRCELEDYLKAKTGEEENRDDDNDDDDGSPSYDKIKELEKYLRETLPNSYQYRDNVQEVNDVVNKQGKDDDEDNEDDEDDSDLHCIELKMDDVSKSFQWRDAVKNESQRNLVDKLNRQGLNKINKQGTLEVIDTRGVFEFASSLQKPSKKDAEDEIERYNMIKDLRDHIVSGTRMASSQQSVVVASKDANGVVCHG